MICNYVNSSTKVTSLLMLIILNHGKYIRQAFDVSLYPTNTPFLLEGSSLVLFSFGTRFISLLRKPLQESCFQVLNDNYGSLHTQMLLLPPTKVHRNILETVTVGRSSLCFLVFTFGVDSISEKVAGFSPLWFSQGKSMCPLSLVID